jgi:hypothetical protein
MKTEMQILPNGNYESVVLPIQHSCRSENYTFHCVEYSYKSGLILKVEDGDPYEDGYSNEILVNFCPFCGYHDELK